MAAASIELNNKLTCPQLGLGTWQSAPGDIYNAVKHAISIGYRHIDCAWIYGNEKEVGRAIKEKIEDKTVTREELFIVTKLWNLFHSRNQVVPACKESLSNLGLDYIDLYLVHWPVAQTISEIKTIDLSLIKDANFVDVDYVETWEGMEDCVRLGLAKSIGLSNFNTKQVRRVLDHAKIKPVMNQIEVSPNLTQKKLIKFCKDNDIAVTAYSPLGSPARPWAKPGDGVVSLDNPQIVSIGEKYGKTSAQVILRFLVQIGTIPIPKSSNKERVEKNIDIFDFELTPEEVKVLESFNCDGRAVPADDFKASKYFPFNED
ncbi:hypothetical protein NQ315_008569 [Exocentrus adspersus]|uniref:NADP-dependent oxidoreductase domain-containing protein n=1 Tax=Exocentrus adspersus TaxID=1586481 RepID=A0AAV8W7C6_9CUCU|nr:hypothetical protein NQ315_008569 [Exocentrus adspersus]